MMNNKFNRIYLKLYDSFGRQHWWPARTKLEIIVGTVLTQNTSWKGVEKAIINLIKNRLLSLKSLSNVDVSKLANLIKPAGYFNLKAKRLKNIIEFFKQNYKGSLVNAKGIKTPELREQLLSINGVGPETADSILLYAFMRPIFVVDAYTKRIFSRLKILPSDSSYDFIQNLFMKNLKPNTYLFNEYHALIVKLGKDYCKKNNPRCNECPVRGENKGSCNY